MNNFLAAIFLTLVLTLFWKRNFSLTLNMFLGEYQHSLDDKGRLAIPAKFRSAMAGGAVVTKGLESCLFLYPKKDWQTVAEKIASRHISQRAFARLMLGGAMDVDLDKQGRVILPDYLRKYAGLKKQTIMVGLYDRLEIWDQSAWEKYKTQSEKDSAKIAETLGELGV